MFYTLKPSEIHHQRKGIFNHTKDLNFCNHSRKGSGQLLSSLRHYTLNSLVNPGINEARFPTSLTLHFTSHYYCSFLKLVVFVMSIPLQELQMKLLKRSCVCNRKENKAYYELLSLFLKSKSIVDRQETDFLSIPPPALQR